MSTFRHLGNSMSALSALLPQSKAGEAAGKEAESSPAGGVELSRIQFSASVPDSHIRRDERISNGCCMSRTGHRSLSFEADLSLSPVTHAVYSGYQPDRATYQQRGEYLLTFAWGHGDPGTLYLNGRPMLLTQEGRDIYARLVVRHPWIESFLSEDTRGPSYIPEDIVPKDNYISNERKRRYLESSFRRYGLPMKPDEFMSSRREDLQLEPQALTFNPDEYRPCYEYQSGSLVDISREERWYGSDGRGHCTELDIKPFVHSRSFFAHSDTQWTEGEAGLPGWKDYVFLIRVRTGVHTSMGRSHYSHGKAIDVFVSGQQSSDMA